MEKWKDIPSFEGVYSISDEGRLKSFKMDKGGRVMKMTNSKGDYFRIILSTKTSIRHASIHRLVAEAFIPNLENKEQVNHKDGNKQNNVVENLEWVTAKENMSHAINMFPQILNEVRKYNKYVRPKAIKQITADGELLAIYPNSVSASKVTGVCQRNILQVASKEEYKPGKTRSQAGGYIWEYAV